LKKLQGVFWSANQRFWKQMLMVRAGLAWQQSGREGR
jgi:hypothetical protein